MIASSKGRPFIFGPGFGTPKVLMFNHCISSSHSHHLSKCLHDASNEHLASNCQRFACKPSDHSWQTCQNVAKNMRNMSILTVVILFISGTHSTSSMSNVWLHPKPFCDKIMTLQHPSGLHAHCTYCSSLWALG